MNFIRKGIAVICVAVIAVLLVILGIYLKYKSVGLELELHKEAIYIEEKVKEHKEDIEYKSNVNYTAYVHLMLDFTDKTYVKVGVPNLHLNNTGYQSYVSDDEDVKLYIVKGVEFDNIGSNMESVTPNIVKTKDGGSSAHIVKCYDTDHDFTIIGTVTSDSADWSALVNGIKDYEFISSAKPVEIDKHDISFIDKGIPELEVPNSLVAKTKTYKDGNIISYVSPIGLYRAVNCSKALMGLVSKNLNSYETGGAYLIKAEDTAIACVKLSNDTTGIFIANGLEPVNDLCSYIYFKKYSK